MSAQLSEIATAQQRIATALADLHAQQNDPAAALARLRGCIQTPGECRGPVLVLPER